MVNIDIIYIGTECSKWIKQKSIYFLSNNTFILLLLLFFLTLSDIQYRLSIARRFVKHRGFNIILAINKKLGNLSSMFLYVYYVFLTLLDNSNVHCKILPIIILRTGSHNNLEKKSISSNYFTELKWERSKYP